MKEETKVRVLDEAYIAELHERARLYAEMDTAGIWSTLEADRLVKEGSEK